MVMPKRRRTVRKTAPFGSRITDHFSSKNTKSEGQAENPVKTELFPVDLEDANDVKTKDPLDLEVEKSIKSEEEQVSEVEKDDATTSGHRQNECEINSDEDLFEHDVSLEANNAQDQIKTELGQDQDENEINLKAEKIKIDLCQDQTETADDSGVNLELGHDLEFESESEADHDGYEAISDADLFDEAEEPSTSAAFETSSSPNGSCVELGAEEDEGDYSGATSDLAFLRKFDMDWRFGPCIGISRLERFDRAVRNGMAPPQRVRSLVLQHASDERFTQCVWHVYNYL